ncbi:Engulfment/cell motility, ELMO [Artemisia annua]|uniref:Engulfment/cell motility, ELMO n=1 Tax=Artemisia annua TaxID=35608 RepID=A0A2U1QMY3_ARTAN|nr:Engulfment/cell motility, ELMO [Artemisia annua]
MKLQNRIDISYDSSVAEHQEALRALWKAAFPEEELHCLITEQWKEIGWQRKDPSTYFPGGWFISLGNLLYFARNFPANGSARVINFFLTGQTRIVECSGALYFMQKSFLHKDLGIDLGSLVLSQKKCSGALFSQFLFS